MAVIENDYDNLTEVLETISTKLNIYVSSFDMTLYLKLFKKRLIEKQSDGSALWLDDVEIIVEEIKSEGANVEGSTFVITQSFCIDFFIMNTNFHMSP